MSTVILLPSILTVSTSEYSIQAVSNYCWNPLNAQCDPLNVYYDFRIFFFCLISEYDSFDGKHFAINLRICFDFYSFQKLIRRIISGSIFLSNGRLEGHKKF